MGLELEAQWPVAVLYHGPKGWTAPTGTAPTELLDVIDLPPEVWPRSARTPSSGGWRSCSGACCAT